MENYLSEAALKAAEEAENSARATLTSLLIVMSSVIVIAAWCTRHEWTWAHVGAVTLLMSVGVMLERHRARLLKVARQFREVEK